MWEDWQFVLGEWQGEGGRKPGQGVGGFTFCPDLDDRILVRRNHVDYQAVGGQAAFSHEDLLIVYLQPGQPFHQAIYFDNEGHVIHYSAYLAPNHELLILISEIQPAAPSYRLSYFKTGEDALHIYFEMAPPGQPGNFIPYTNGTARRKGV